MLQEAWPPLACALAEQRDFLRLPNTTTCSGFKLPPAWRLSNTALWHHGELVQNMHHLSAISEDMGSFPKRKMDGMNTANVADLMKAHQNDFISQLSFFKKEKLFLPFFPILLMHGSQYSHP